MYYEKVKISAEHFLKAKLLLKHDLNEMKRKQLTILGLYIHDIIMHNECQKNRW